MCCSFERPSDVEEPSIPLLGPRQETFVDRGKVCYSDSDGGNDAVWAKNLEAFFKRAPVDPCKFLDAGCYTRYFDGKTDRQFIPETFLHDRESSRCREG
jgi:hypothetical protein